MCELRAGCVALRSLPGAVCCMSTTRCSWNKPLEESATAGWVGWLPPGVNVITMRQLGAQELGHHWLMVMADIQMILTARLTLSSCIPKQLGHETDSYSVSWGTVIYNRLTARSHCILEAMNKVNMHTLLPNECRVRYYGIKTMSHVQNTTGRPYREPLTYKNIKK